MSISHITALYMPSTLAIKVCQPLSNFVFLSLTIQFLYSSGGDNIQHNTSTGGDKLKKCPSVPVDSNICIHLSLDLQRQISRYLLSQEAYMSFRLVCKLWRSVAPPLRWKVADHAAPCYDQDSMWLLSLNQKDGCEIRYAKDGWLLVSRGSK
ncbi:hypothetical protein KY285_003219 [Solanum tuberosum]|nr:hypothetical protein KY284_003390 [Solanum tuberosum]KAH0732290.1 hypothetical protein KY289_003478 [Solanum tuberosum]KAH0767348.1 hypothetical protein KY285_003219 [Solanum tuberosum]